MFFGPPLPRSRLYSELFRGSTPFQPYVLHSCGWRRKLRDLLHAYLSAENRLTFAEEGLLDGETPILDKIKNNCEAAFREAASGWIDQHATLVSEEMYKNWISRIKSRYPKLWATFASLRGINEKVKRNNKLIERFAREHKLMEKIGLECSGGIIRSKEMNEAVEENKFECLAPRVGADCRLGICFYTGDMLGCLDVVGSAQEVHAYRRIQFANASSQNQASQESKRHDIRHIWLDTRLFVR